MTINKDKRPNIGIIGHIEHAPSLHDITLATMRSIHEQTLENALNVYIPNDGRVYINGNWYLPIKREGRKSQLELYLGYYEEILIQHSICRKATSRPAIKFTLKEVELIMQKKSNLSANQRAEIMRQFEKRYELIK